METVIEISRYLLPIITVVVLTKCMMALWFGHPKEKTYGYIVDLFDGERYALNMWETSIGRSNSCDIVLGYETVSRIQAVIARRNDSWYIHDIKSKSGIKVGGKKIEKKQTIRPGDIITMGSMRFRFEIADDPVIRVGRKKGRGKKKKTAAKTKPAAPKSAPGQADLTAQRYYSPSGTQGVLSQPSQPRRTRKSTRPTLINKRTGDAFVLCGNEVAIGSSHRSHIRLSGENVAKRHALAVLYDDGWAIEDCGSKKPTRLNGKRVTEPQLLFEGDVIDIGSEKLWYKLS